MRQVTTEEIFVARERRRLFEPVHPDESVLFQQVHAACAGRREGLRTAVRGAA
jgi:hypothetical protein